MCNLSPYFNFSTCIFIQLNLIYMLSLEQLLKRIKTFQQIFIYNKRVVDPYLLAAQGLVISSANTGEDSKTIATCSNQNCNLVIELDNLEGEEELKEDIENAVMDHDLECPFNQQTPLRLNYPLFKQNGHIFFEQRYSNIQAHQKFIQLSPKEIVIALNLQERDNLQMSPANKVNITLEMFRNLDKRLNGEKLTKIKSIIFLALFGWEFSEANQNEMVCHFCASNKNVFEFISPSQCTLMSLPNGFQFISAHKPWCCLIRPTQPLWRQVLKQTVMHRLDAIDGRMCKNQSEMRCKDIQDNAIKVYTSNYGNWTIAKKKLEQVKSNIQVTFVGQSQKNTQIRESFAQSIHHLEDLFQNCKETIETFVKRIKMK